MAVPEENPVSDEAIRKQKNRPDPATAIEMMKHINDVVARLPERVCLIRDEGENAALYAIGWSRHDLLVDLEDLEGNVLVTGRPLRTLMTRGGSLYTQIDKKALKALWGNRPPESDVHVPEDRFEFVTE